MGTLLSQDHSADPHTSSFNIPWRFMETNHTGAGQLSGEVALVALGEDLDLIPSIHMQLTTICNRSSRGPRALLTPRALHASGACAYLRPNSYTHKIKALKKTFKVLDTHNEPVSSLSGDPEAHEVSKSLNKRT